MTVARVTVTGCTVTVTVTSCTVTVKGRSCFYSKPLSLRCSAGLLVLGSLHLRATSLPAIQRGSPLCLFAYHCCFFDEKYSAFCYDKAISFASGIKDWPSNAFLSNVVDFTWNGL